MLTLLVLEETGCASVTPSHCPVVRSVPRSWSMVLGSATCLLSPVPHRDTTGGQRLAQVSRCGLKCGCVRGLVASPH